MPTKVLPNYQIIQANPSTLKSYKEFCRIAKVFFDKCTFANLCCGMRSSKCGHFVLDFTKRFLDIDRKIILRKMFLI